MSSFRLIGADPRYPFSKQQGASSSYSILPRDAGGAIPNRLAV